MPAKKYKCPKCNGFLKTEVNKTDCGYEVYQVVCRKCGLEGEVSLTEEFAMACFRHEHGDGTVSTYEIEQSGGPPRRTMRWRIHSQHYSEAQKEKRGWKLPRETADRIVEEWKQRKDGMVPLAEVALRCGLGSTSLNLRVTRGIIRATLFSNRWYVTKEEMARLLRYYHNTVTSSEAARILGFSHRSYLRRLPKEKLPYECLGVVRRYRLSVLQDFLASRSASK